MGTQKAGGVATGLRARGLQVVSRGAAPATKHTILLVEVTGTVTPGALCAALGPGPQQHQEERRRHQCHRRGAPRPLLHGPRRRARPSDGRPGASQLRALCPSWFRLHSRARRARPAPSRRARLAGGGRRGRPRPTEFDRVPPLLGLDLNSFGSSGKAKENTRSAGLPAATRDTGWSCSPVPTPTLAPTLRNTSK